MMRHYVISRQLPRYGTWLLVTGMLAAVVGRVMLTVPSLRGGDQFLLPLDLVLPAAAAALVGQTTRCFMADLEQVAARAIRAVRLGHGLALVVVAIVAFLPAMVWSQEGHGHGGWAVLRNLIGYIGLAYLGAQVFGAGLSWVVPLFIALLCPVFGIRGRAVPLWWAWPLQPAGSATSWVWAGGLCVAGVVAFTVRAVPQTAAEDPLDLG
ncbi:hypothetical protein [Frankia sp. Cppng1_Ct_nod]|uniref:hypothetical protein n=1 Tax=Frankia sp. Cppng1_Ct_nod TaxID=2897162 RepID=UPI0010410EAF|nr:hypothetical protein [Frankia sp. Cppng1_Ct_nod]